MKKILIVDDDFTLIKSLETVLPKYNFEVSIARNYIEFNKKFKEKFDVILLDIGLPDKNGIDILHQIREYDKEVVVIMITGFATVDNTIRALQEGANDFIVKPFDSVERVITLINNAIKRQEILLENITLKKINRLKDELIALISHEFRTPITIIKGYIDILPEEMKNKYEYFNEIEKEINHLTKLIEEITLIARLRYIRLNKREINIKDLIDEVLINFFNEIQEKNITIIKDIKVDKINGDKELIKVVFNNLIDNAIKFSFKGSSVEIRIYKENKRVKIEIKDYGIGIKKEHLNIIFDSFKQSEDYMKRSKGGMGLGLFIVKEILKLHSSEIFVDSKINKGSTFFFYLED